MNNKLLKDLLQFCDDNEYEIMSVDISNKCKEYPTAVIRYNYCKIRVMQYVDGDWE